MSVDEGRGIPVLSGELSRAGVGALGGSVRGVTGSAGKAFETGVRAQTLVIETEFLHHQLVKVPRALAGQGSHQGLQIVFAVAGLGARGRCAADQLPCRGTQDETGQASFSRTWPAPS